jgi:hypothetical protein
MFKHNMRKSSGDKELQRRFYFKTPRSAEMFHTSSGDNMGYKIAQIPHIKFQ